MERREDLHRHGCSIAKQTILTTHPSGLQTRVSVELANFDALCVHSECSTKPKRPMWEGSPFLSRRGILGGVSAHGTPVLGRRSDAVNEGRLSQQCTPVMRRREVESPGGSPLPVRRCEEESESEVDNSVISGWLKFRDNKRMNTTLDYQYYVVELTKDCPHPSYPRFICIPQSWIKATFKESGRVAVVLPKEEYATTASRVRDEGPGDEWALYWAFIKDRKNDFDTAVNNARVCNEALQYEAVLPQENEQALENSPQEESETEESSDEQRELMINKSKDMKDSEISNITNMAKTEPIRSETDKDLNKIKPQYHTRFMQNLLGNHQQNYTKAAKVPDEDEIQYKEHDVIEDKRNHDENEELLVEKEMDHYQRQNEMEEEEIQSQNWIENDISSDESWEPSETEHRKYSTSSEENKMGQSKKILKKCKKNSAKVRKRKIPAESHHKIYSKKLKRLKTSQSENEATPSTSKSGLRSFKNKRKDISRLKYMRILSQIYKDLEESLIRFDEYLQVLGTILNKITGFFIESIYTITLLIDGEDTDNSNTNQNLNSEESAIKQSISNNDDGEDQQEQETNGGENGGNSPSSFSTEQPHLDSMDKRSKWTLRYEEFKPQAGLTELLPGCGIYISEKGLQKCKEIPYNSPTKLARHVLCEIFSDEALRTCTLLGGKSSKPGLDDYARRQLLAFVKQFSLEKGWDLGDKFQKSIFNTLSGKLWEISQEHRDNKEK